MAALVGQISTEDIKVGKQVPCPSPIAQQVVYFEDDKCTKLGPGQTPETATKLGAEFTKNSSAMVEKCSVQGGIGVMMTCHEEGVVKITMYMDKECKQELNVAALPKETQEKLPPMVTKMTDCTRDDAMGRFVLVSNEQTKKMGQKLPFDEPTSSGKDEGKDSQDGDDQGKDGQSGKDEGKDSQDGDDQGKDGQQYKFSGDGYDINVEMSQPKFGGEQMTSEMKFDKYYMFGIDNMGGNGNNAPQCGPENVDACKKIAGPQSCCAHAVMTGNDGQQTSVFRCLNQRVVDAAFKVSMDGMEISMACTKAMRIAAGFAASSAIMAAMVIF